MIHHSTARYKLYLKSSTFWQCFQQAIFLRRLFIIDLSTCLKKGFESRIIMKSILLK